MADLELIHKKLSGRGITPQCRREMHLCPHRRQIKPVGDKSSNADKRKLPRDRPDSGDFSR